MQCQSNESASSSRWKCLSNQSLQAVETRKLGESINISLFRNTVVVVRTKALIMSWWIPPDGSLLPAMLVCGQLVFSFYQFIFYTLLTFCEDTRGSYSRFPLKSDFKIYPPYKKKSKLYSLRCTLICVQILGMNSAWCVSINSSDTKVEEVFQSIEVSVL